MLSSVALVPLRSLTFIILLVSFAVVSVMVGLRVTDALDNHVLNALTSSRTYILDITMVVVTTTADIFPVYFSPMLIISFILLIRRKSRRVGAILIIAILVATLVTLQVKNIVHKDRPEYEFNIEGLNYKLEYDALSKASSSYPSAHAARSAAFALIISYMLKGKRVGRFNLGFILWLYPLLISLSRVYVGEHYVTDVVGGTILGLIVANFIGRVFKAQLID
jgi:undecaprenyl-diphosphatase